MPDESFAEPGNATRIRRPRYRGKNPRRFEEKYKERDPERYGEAVAKVLAAGKTPAGMHRPIMVEEVLEVLAPQAGEVAVDCTLGHGGHAEELLRRLQPGGHLFGLDADPVELPKTEARLRTLGFGPESFSAFRSNFAGLAKVLGRAALPGADAILADLGVSSMQLDDPARGFSFKAVGPLDMRINPSRGQPASVLVQNATPSVLAELLAANSDEPHAHELATVIAGKDFATTVALAAAIRAALPRVKEEERELSVRRVFQALRIAVNDEFAALDAFLRVLPGCLKSGGRVAILTFHSGEDRRVKKAFQAGLRDGHYAAIAGNVTRPTPAERQANPRSTSAKMRWAQGVSREAGAKPSVEAGQRVFAHRFAGAAGGALQSHHEFARRHRRTSSREQEGILSAHQGREAAHPGGSARDLAAAIATSWPFFAPPPVA